MYLQSRSHYIEQQCFEPTVFAVALQPVTGLALYLGCDRVRYAVCSGSGLLRGSLMHHSPSASSYAAVPSSASHEARLTAGSHESTLGGILPRLLCNGSAGKDAPQAS